jgi:hypothetical protein
MEDISPSSARLQHPVLLASLQISKRPLRALKLLVLLLASL